MNIKDDGKIMELMLQYVKYQSKSIRLKVDDEFLKVIFFFNLIIYYSLFSDPQPKNVIDLLNTNPTI